MIANQSLGVRIRYFRKKKGFTQKELGEAIGVNDSTIRNYELGNRTPDANTMAKIRPKEAAENHGNGILPTGKNILCAYAGTMPKSKTRP